MRLRMSMRMQSHRYQQMVLRFSQQILRSVAIGAKKLTGAALLILRSMARQQLAVLFLRTVGLR